MSDTSDADKLFKSASNTLKAVMLRTHLNKQKAEKRLRPLYGDGWDLEYLKELEKEAAISQLQLQICNMDNRDIAEWVYNLQEKQL